MDPEQEIFQQGSKTYYNSALFFPRRMREDVTKLYSFVRVADNYVDAQPQHLHEFRNLVAVWQEYRGRSVAELAPEKSDTLSVRVTKNICRLKEQHNFDPAWIDAFLHSMELDTRQKIYYTMDDTLRYMHGSAEVIGLMMAQLMHVPEKAMHYAAMQGRAMQFINFLRDIREDIELDRCYFPKNDLEKFGLSDLGELTAKAHSQAFRGFMRFELGRYHQWQHEANQGMHYIPKRCRLPIQGAADAYGWTARQIARDPFVVYRYKVKPSKARIIGNALVHVFD